MNSVLLNSYQSIMGPGFQPTITSGLRSGGANAKVGGKGTSKHLSGNAIDIRSNDSVMTKGQGDAVAASLNSSLGRDYDVLQHGKGANRHIHMEYDPKAPEAGDPFPAKQKTAAIKDSGVDAPAGGDTEKMKALMGFLVKDFAPILATAIANAGSRKAPSGKSGSVAPNPF